MTTHTHRVHTHSVHIILLLFGKIRQKRALVEAYCAQHGVEDIAIDWDAIHDGTRYVQHCLGTPDEAKRREVFMDGIWSGHPKPLLLWDSERPVPRREHAPYWSAFYAANERDPTSYHMAEYVRRVYCPNAPAAAMPLPRGADAAARGDSDASLQRRLVRLAGASRA